MYTYRYQRVNMKNNFTYHDSKKCISGVIILVTFLLLWSMASESYAGILWSQDFNDDSTGAYSISDLKEDFNAGFLSLDWNKPLDDVDIVNDAKAREGKSLRVFHTKGKSGNSNGMAWQASFDYDLEEIYVSFWIKFDPDWKWYEGGKIIGPKGGKPPGAGYKPDGTDGWSARVNWSKKNGVDGCGIQYVYHPDMPGKYGDNIVWNDGDSKYIYPKGEWIHIESRYKMNTPKHFNGIIQTWVNGKMVQSRTNLRMRDVDTFSINKMRFDHWFGSASPQNQYTWFDNIVISTHRVGPGGQNLKDPPGPPKNLRIIE